MRVFVTDATGAAATLTQVRTSAHRGALEDLESLTGRLVRPMGR
jgi:hypothetical protein